ncbi:uncharacterized protein LOC110265121 [Arachis ipaensis]|uniref:uncharacterized protein LOC110265121 n=1 Tax=Arachis ipaensis TaxID=130454 RepID=UPI000A2B6105|nr:uncharacterized protein LOC110265121 [Arachis ipaensis]
MERSKKVKKSTEEGGREFTGDTALVPRMEDWMAEEEMEENGNSKGTEQPQLEVERVVEFGASKSNSFADTVRMGKSTGGGHTQREQEPKTNSAEDTDMEESDDEDTEIIVKKLPNGIYNLVIGEGVKRELRKEWWETLIVKLLGRKISLLALKRRLEILWGKRGSIDVIDLGNDFFLVKFFSSEDLDFALTEGPWKILDHYLTIRFWKPDFNPSEASIDTIAAWIRLPGLAIEYYHRAILEKIGNIVGRTLKVDSNTAEVSRGKFARICVEVDLTKPLVAQYQINGKNRT